MNIINENKNSEQFEKIFTNKKIQIKNENANENENEIKIKNDNENFEKFFTNISKTNKNKNKTKKINFEIKNKQFATTLIHEADSKMKFEKKKLNQNKQIHLQ